MTEGSLLLLDTSVAVALLVEDHQGHSSCREALRGHQLGLGSHAVFEALSVTYLGIGVTLIRLSPEGASVM